MHLLVEIITSLKELKGHITCLVRVRSMVAHLHSFIIVNLRRFAERAHLFALFFGNVTVKIRNANAEVLFHEVVVWLIRLVVDVIV